MDCFFAGFPLTLNLAIRGKVNLQLFTKGAREEMLDEGFAKDSGSFEEMTTERCVNSEL
jgi:hypothetical protein